MSDEELREGRVMNEYRCPCGWGATARTLEGMLAASEHHQREGCATTNETREDQ